MGRHSTRADLALISVENTVNSYKEGGCASKIKYLNQKMHKAIEINVRTTMATSSVDNLIIFYARVASSIIFSIYSHFFRDRDSRLRTILVAH